MLTTGQGGGGKPQPPPPTTGGGVSTPSSAPSSQAGFSSVYEDAANQGPWTLVQELSPEQQRLYEQDLRIREAQGNIGEGMLGSVRDVYSRPAEYAGNLPDFNQISAPTYTGKGSTDLSWQGPSYRTSLDSRDAAERALYNRALRYAEPQMQKEEQALHERLLAQGFNVGDPAYQRAMDELAQRRERVFADARDAAIIGGGREATEELQRGLGAEQARFGAGVTAEDLNARLAQAMFGAGMTGAQFGSQERNAALQHALQRIQLQQQDRARLLNELNAFRTGQQVQLPNLPAQFSTPGLQGIDLLGTARQGYADQLGAYNAEEAASGGFLSGLMGMAGTALGGPLGGALGSWLFPPKPTGKGG